MLQGALFSSPGNSIEHFQAMWRPVRVKKMQLNKDLELLSGTAESESALIKS
jgi:hypothetical protein